MQQALSRIRFGADPEIFLTKRIKVNKAPEGAEVESDDYGYKFINQPVPVTGLIGGTKTAPLPFNNKTMGVEGGLYPPGAAIQEDGAALEFNVAPAPAINRLFRDINQIVSTINHWARDKGLRLYSNSTAEFSAEYKATHPQAFVVGCDPDMDAYTGQMREAPDAVAESLVRCAGGHIHVGYDRELVPPHIVAKFMDLILGLPSIFVDKQEVRREFYGRAGSFRIKEYGIEYRTLSNFWVPNLKYHSEYTQIMFCGLDVLMPLFVRDIARLETLYKAVPWEEVQTAINTENPKMAEQLISFAHRLDANVMRCAVDFMSYATKKGGIPKVRY